jgi:ribosomal protein S18 acetylase RimI-like enzyme
VVVTPSHRGKRLGALVTSAVTAALLRDAFDLIVLNVRQDNAPAIATYLKLGYYITGNFIEGIAER